MVLAVGVVLSWGALASTPPTEATRHSADYQFNGKINLVELLRVIQFFNMGEFHCQAGTEDGYAPGSGARDCAPHASDYNGGPNWRINLMELLRVIQFFNVCGYAVEAGTEDGFSPVLCSGPEGEGEGIFEGEGLPEGEGEGIVEGEGEGVVEGEGEGPLEGEGEPLKYARVIVADGQGAPGALVAVGLQLDVLNVAPSELQFDLLFNSNRLTYYGNLAGEIVTEAGKVLTVTEVNFGQLRIRVSGGLPTQGMSPGIMAALGFTLSPATDYGEVYSLFAQSPTASDAFTGAATDLSVIAGSITVYSAAPVAPVAEFAATPKRGLPGTEIQFTDTSRMGNGDSRTWSWTFGDGSTSTLRNPTHTYVGIGAYNVSLRVTTSAGADTVSKDALIEIVAGVRIYVDKDNAPEGEIPVEGEGIVLDGLSWGTAFATIQAGINAAFAAGGGEVWVADGLYDEVRVNSTGTLFLREVVRLYGGFAGGETAVTQRDWAANETIIDGSKARNGEAAYHVVAGANNSYIDGFTIRGGRAKVIGTSTSSQQGGGMYNPNVSVVVANCYFTDNIAERVGGAIYNGGGSPRIVNCRFVSNKVECLGNPSGFAYGGAIYNSDTRVTITNCDFVTNQAKTSASWQGAREDIYAYAYGAGVYSYNSTVILEDCLFHQNAATAESTGDGVLSGDTFGAYAQALGGGVYSRFGTATITRCAFLDNQTSTNSHGIFTKASGGGLYQIKGKLTLTNSVVYSNNSNDFSNRPERAAGIYNDAAEQMTLANCTFVGNLCDTNNLSHGGGLFNWYSSPTVTNCIFWSNSGEGIQSVESTPLFTYCDTQDGVLEGIGNISSNPQFVQINSGDLRIQAGSPCVDTGRDTSPGEFGFVTVDITGNLRGFNGNAFVNADGSDYDIGAYEYRP